MRTGLLFGTAIAAADAAFLPSPITNLPAAETFISNLLPTGIMNPIAGFLNPTYTSTQGGQAYCIQGLIPVTASATNQILHTDNPADNIALTNTITQFLQVGSTLPQTVVGASNTISGTYNIHSKLCFPKTGNLASIGTSPMQFLIHGVGFDKSYWDFYNSTYSYADAMAKQGYTTFSFDRLGVGLSDHPSPLQVVQSPLELSISHALIQMLRSGKISSVKFSKIVGVGHSFGSFQINGLTAQYPTDLDAAVLTGFTVNQAGVPAFLSGLNLDTAAHNSASRFGSLPTGYMVSSTSISNQFSFFRAPNFDPAVLTAAESSKQTLTLGELFSLGSGVGPATAFTGPVAWVIGQNDMPFCQSDCGAGGDQTAVSGKILYPAAKASMNLHVPGAGHAVNMHFGCGAAYTAVGSFLKGNGY